MSVPEQVLYDPKVSPAFQQMGGEAVPQRVWADGLGDSGVFGESADNTCGLVSIQPCSRIGSEDRTFEAFANGEIHVSAEL